MLLFSLPVFLILLFYSQKLFVLSFLFISVILSKLSFFVLVLWITYSICPYFLLRCVVKRNISFSLYHCVSSPASLLLFSLSFTSCFLFVFSSSVLSMFLKDKLEPQCGTVLNKPPQHGNIRHGTVRKCILLHRTKLKFTALN